MRVFISYKHNDHSTRIANLLHQQLEADGIAAFLDTEEMRSGDEWAQMIYREISLADVLIVLLDAETAKSEWVQREVDTARGAKVEIMPILTAKVDVANAMEKLAISSHQFDFYDGDEAAYRQYIYERIPIMAQRTQAAQQAWLKELNTKWRIPKAPDVQRYRSYHLRNGAHPCEIILTTGDMLQTEAIDVLVNSENDYMQMARVFEYTRVSSILRYRGARFNRAGRITEDTVQRELDAQIAYDPGAVPLEPTMVIPTHAGHPDSRLRRDNSARYIFHIASVLVNHGLNQKTLQPVDTDQGVQACVQNCLALLLRINADQGVISPPGSAKRATEAASTTAYQPLTSIIFPLFGTGAGGRDANAVIPPMLRAIEDFLTRVDRQQQLAQIHVCVYPQPDVAVAEEHFNAHFDAV